MNRKKNISRRDFLKFVSLIPLTWLARPIAHATLPKREGNVHRNVIILVFDAWSANHLRFYGYPRDTMPNLERFMEKATVFHNHYSAGTFTIPGTASMLTGLYPWSHRAFSLGSGGIIKEHLNDQIFSIFSNTHSTLAYAQNKFADILLFQCAKYLDTHLKVGAFNLEHRFLYNFGPFKNDPQMAFASLENNILLDRTTSSSSLFVNPIYNLWKTTATRDNDLRFSDEYPLGLPDNTEQFLLADVVDGAIQTLRGLEEPGFVYFHFYPPHENYMPLKPFRNIFNDGWQPPVKPVHRLSWGKKSRATLNQLNREYDEYMASWDAEVSRLFQYMEDSGLLERSYVIITADHGELNERGERGHFTPLIFDPLIHIPLIIFQPGQKKRKDVHTYTSSIDLLPTLAHLIGSPAPSWVEGELLPEFGGVNDPGRSIYSMDAKTNASLAPLTKTSISLTKNHQRLTYYKYPDGEQFEFYNLEEDREELRDLYPSRPADAVLIRDELLQKLDEVNRLFKA
ncbi:MAG: sulfatase-like hydrolase/transferase [Chloroflexi bacterium]|nr:sulfatase-like hydrolase/transferase [Chloroflexota bacterium]